MSDLMLHGVLNMPLPDDPSKIDLVTWVQFKDRATQASSRIEELEERLKAATDDANEAEAYAGELEAKLAKAVGLLEAWINVATHCTIKEGVCCCGDNMDTHAEPMHCGHSPVDHGAYIAESLVEKTNTTLAELTGGKDE